MSWERQPYMSDIGDLLNDLRNGSWWVRKDAIKALRNCPRDQYLPVFEGWLRDGYDDLARNAAMEALRAVGGKAVDTLTRLIEDADSDVRLFSANVLGDISDTGAIPALVRALGDEDINVRTAVVEALGKSGEQSVVNDIVKVAGEDSWLTIAVIQALGVIGGDEAVEALHGFLLKDEFRVVAIFALRRAGGEKTINRLKPFIANKDASGSAALTAVVGIVERIDLKLPSEYFMGQVEKLIPLLESPDEEVGRAAFAALSWAGDVKALPYLISAVTDEALQEYAISGLIRIGKKALPGMIDELRSSEQTDRGILAKLLCMIGDEKALVQFSEDEDPEVRTEVALSLGTSEVYVGYLTKMLDDPSGEVREAARQSLQRLP